MRNAIRNRGSVLVYTAFGCATFVAFVSLASDGGRYFNAKNELQSATDASARYAVYNLHNTINGVSAASVNAVAAAAQNKCDGTPVVIDPTADVSWGTWNAATRVFTPTTLAKNANAVKVVGKRTLARGNALELNWISILGLRSVDIQTTSIARIDYDTTVGNAIDFNVPATSNPWLSGMPAGSVASVNNPANNPDYAGTKSTPKQSPIDASAIDVDSGTSLTFDGINGGANNSNNAVRYTADGNLGQIVSNSAGAENGMSNVTAPINSLVAIFLNDDQPNKATGATPANLDFSSATSRDFATLRPAVRQMFFVGDGRTSGGEVQQFVVPAGATRLYVGTMDGWEWNNNVGSFSFTVHRSGRVTLVR